MDGLWNRVAHLGHLPYHVQIISMNYLQQVTAEQLFTLMCKRCNGNASDKIRFTQVIMVTRSRVEGDAAYSV